MNPDIRVYAIVTLFVLFAALSLYSTVSAIYSLGRNDGERIRIEHLQRLAPQPGHKQESFGSSVPRPCFFSKQFWSILENNTKIQWSSP